MALQATAYLKPKTRRIRPKPTLPKRLSTHEFRERAEALTEQMIALLDTFDGDENLEDGADKEPSLLGGAQHGYDAELDAGEDDIDLGWTNDLDQTRAQRNLDACNGFPAHAETEHDGREPSLGSVAAHEASTQEEWASGGRQDLEHDPAELGEPEGV